jgi:hypothetical protein
LFTNLIFFIPNECPRLIDSHSPCLINNFQNVFILNPKRVEFEGDKSKIFSARY